MIGVVGRQGLQEKKKKRKGWPKILPWSAPSCQIQVRNVRGRHNIYVSRSEHDVEEIMNMSDFDDDKNISRYI